LILKQIQKTNKKFTTSSPSQTLSNSPTILFFSPQVCRKFLQQNLWNLDDSINSFFSSDGKYSLSDSSQGVEKLTKIFNHYAPKNSKLEFKEIEKFFQDLKIENLESIEILIICWKLKAKGCYCISRDEFIEGFLSLHCFSIEEIQKKMNVWKVEKDLYFKEFFEFVFDFSTHESLLNNVAKNILQQMGMSTTTKERIYKQDWMNILND
jgi:hypothetical protein